MRSGRVNDATYIGLEGVDGSGKSTVAAAVVDSLRAEGREVLFVREPGGTVVGEEIRRILLHSHEMDPWAEAALFAAQRAQLATEIVSPALASGVWVVSDRTLYSSLAYQGGARGLGINEVRLLNERVLGGVVPDVVAVLDIDPGVAMSRQLEPDRIGSAGLEFQRLVDAAYRLIASREPDTVHLVPADAPAADIARSVLQLAMVVP